MNRFFNLSVFRGKSLRLPLVLVLLLILIVASLLYFQEPTWTGFDGKTLWAWLELLIIPLALGLGAVFFAWQTRKSEQDLAQRERDNDRELAIDRTREEALQRYLDRMQELILHEQLRESQQHSEVRELSKARTLTVLRTLDSTRKGLALRFLHDTGLVGQQINEEEQKDLDSGFWPDLSIISLHQGDLRGADLRRADLSQAELGGADLSGSDLTEAFLHNAELGTSDLHNANLSRADLFEASLFEVNLSGAKLSRARLIGTDLTSADLTDADLAGAILSKAKLDRANLTHVKNLTIEQLCSALSLYQVVGLAPELLEQVKKQRPQLLEEPQADVLRRASLVLRAIEGESQQSGQ